MMNKNLYLFLYSLSVLLLSFHDLCQGSVSNNVPLDHWSYQSIERLADQGLLLSDMMTTRPISRLEMARLIVETQQNLEAADAPQWNTDPITKRILERLHQEFLFEISQFKPVNLGNNPTFIKPIEDPYYRFIYGRRPFSLENQFGDRYEKGANHRFGFVTRGVIQDTVSFYIHPEYKSPSERDSGIELIEGYGKVALGNFELEYGRDSLWWGPGYHGSLIMGNNMENLTMLKISNPTPILLPGFLKGFGPFKIVYFLTELEKERTIAKPKFTGVRLSIKPHPKLEIGGSRTIMFGGQGVSGVGADDYLQIFWPKNIQDHENQLASFDVSWRTKLPNFMPANSAKIYMEYGGEDSACFHQYRPLFGVKLNDVLKTGRTDVRFEYAKTHVGRYPTTFYNHGIYQSGYTYHGDVMGHHMGTNARDVFVRVSHYLSPDLILGVDFDRQLSDITGLRNQTDQIGTDITWFGPMNLQMQLSYRYQESESKASPYRDSNHILDFSLIYDF